MMIGVAMPEDTFRTIQFFVSENGVDEVSADIRYRNKLRCTCSQFHLWRRCKHLKFINNRRKANDGIYVVQVPEDMPNEDLEEAMESQESFRNLLLYSSRIESV